MNEETRNKTNQTKKPADTQDMETPIPNPAMSNRHGETIENTGQLEDSATRLNMFSHPEFKQEANATMLALAAIGYPAYWLLTKLNTLLSLNSANLPIIGLVGGIVTILILITVKAIAYSGQHHE